ncbi:sensor histidine kinase [Cryptosporangium aurantiacum]|uniref:histidine kinase n=1 Tax=Cryptosporangium aurantiacum TaxID=134849 RepID=A0A1M7RMB1_9ACTN|nr:sensor histidine kinase [Cryptosporangium aurantiacum]SHN47394.1 Signal transduction histidine kinase [Cryptosporangium aurantiacum]
MTTQETARGRDGVREAVVRSAARGLSGTEQLAGGFGTAVMALVLLLATLGTAVLSLVGVGLLLVPTVARGIRALANRERGRLARYGVELPELGSPPGGVRGALADLSLRRELGWTASHATLGFLLGFLGVMLPLAAFRDLTFVLWWWVGPSWQSATSIGVGSVHSTAEALWVSLLGVGWLAVIVGVSPNMARLQSWPARKLLVPDPSVDLSLRVAELTATRAAALDAHALELRRIERSLHDGSQNRLVAVTVLLGAARRAMDRNPADAVELLDRAQDAAETALAELRAVARSILPPVLSDRGLAGALTGLASNCGVPCDVEIDLPGRCAASVEATAYFVVAEALTNVAKHSGAHRATVTTALRSGRLHVEVTDDGYGGADTVKGSGLDGVRRRVEAHDGTFRLDSPPEGPTILAVELPCGS